MAISSIRTAVGSLFLEVTSRARGLVVSLSHSDFGCVEIRFDSPVPHHFIDTQHDKGSTLFFPRRSVLGAPGQSPGRSERERCTRRPRSLFFCGFLKRSSSFAGRGRAYAVAIPEARFSRAAGTP